MSASIDMPTSTLIARLTEDLNAHRVELYRELAELQRKVEALGRDIDGIPAALELARIRRRTESRRDTLEIIGANALGLLAAAAIFVLFVAIVR
jgi:hypothetical protein